MIELKSKLIRNGRRLIHGPTIGWVTWKYVRSILATKPVRTSHSTSGDPVELHVLTYHRDWLLSLWAVKSFYYYAGVDWPLVFHIGGPNQPEMLTGLARHFPDAEIWTMADSDARIESALRERGLSTLLEGRRRSLPIRKITDFILSCNARCVAAMDPDVLFFQPPVEFVTAGMNADVPFFMLDEVSAYCLSEQEIFDSYGVRILPRINTGLYVAPLESFPLTRCDELLADERFYRAWMAEQTLQAVVGCEHGARHLPDTYRVSEGRTLHTPDGKPIIAKHYTNIPRPDLFWEGIRHLALRTDFLRALS